MCVSVAIEGDEVYGHDRLGLQESWDHIWLDRAQFNKSLANHVSMRCVTWIRYWDACQNAQFEMRDWNQQMICATEMSREGLAWRLCARPHRRTKDELSSSGDLIWACIVTKLQMQSCMHEFLDVNYLEQR